MKVAFPNLGDTAMYGGMMYQEGYSIMDLIDGSEASFVVIVNFLLNKKNRLCDVQQGETKDARGGYSRRLPKGLICNISKGP